jgi:hypothetical protein
VTITRNWITYYTIYYPYLLGFIKTSVLASLGEVMALRIKQKRYVLNLKTLEKWFVWGLLGMTFVLVFPLFHQGVIAAQSAGLLPRIESIMVLGTVLTAFLTSILMNLIFAPTFMILHRITDSYIDLSDGSIKKMVRIPFKDIIDHINWKFFFGFVVFQTIPFFWIPAHTITFLLPEVYRVLMAAYLSIALGMILSIKHILPVKEKNSF